jgi:hypothetical protein
MQGMELIDQMENDRNGFVINAEIPLKLLDQARSPYVFVLPSGFDAFLNPMSFNVSQDDFALNSGFFTGLTKILGGGSVRHLKFLLQAA